ncbi:patatin-like phospholipase domain-containing protein 3 [Fistulifera solaris]|uniref:Patatin-like phospholipase domain-containing protein 3 n=1 Tax=Fistulifera solaris TaxID=1519565 RepID=A0A1Z5KLJ5_FISSO|nr:patatin-like phospholipase domain-containing protein 3 [Fistulifera solaris]|eukprot:GAX26808.1 patatin-like phospholipase domain-containing protein 3 [Fistulifera solaris]
MAHNIRSTTRHFTSISFSGAGFLACYHLGVAECLLRHNVLSTKLIVTGVSGGALVASALLAGVTPTDGMLAALAISEKTRQHRFDALQPGFSLVDEMYQHFQQLVRDAVKNEEHFLQQVNGTLRIGLTDRRVFPPIGENPHAYIVVDTYRSVEDVLAAALLSSYIPGVTGPLGGIWDTRHSVLPWASRQVHAMMAEGCVKHGVTGQPIVPHHDVTSREICWDGGLVNAFPIIDQQTLMVAPVAVDFPYHPHTINPAMRQSSAERVLRLNQWVSFHLTRENAIRLRQIVVSSDADVLQARFAEGYDDAQHYLERNNLISVHRIVTTSTISNDATMETGKGIGLS